MSEGACLDSSVLIKVLTPELGSAAAAALAGAAADLFAPAFAWAEVGSALRKKVRTRALDAEQADRAWAAFLDLGVIFVDVEHVRTRAWRLAAEFVLPTLYDAAFLAVAELAPGGPHPLWTADERLLGAVGGRHPLVRALPVAPGPLLPASSPAPPGGTDSGPAT